MFFHIFIDLGFWIPKSINYLGGEVCGLGSSHFYA